MRPHGHMPPILKAVANVNDYFNNPVDVMNPRQPSQRGLQNRREGFFIVLKSAKLLDFLLYYGC